jgi:DNA-binding MarR family transcriptional regulator
VSLNLIAADRQEIMMPFPRGLSSLNPRRLALTEDHIVSVLLFRRARSPVLGEHLFSDPAWDILLELYAAKLGGRRMSLLELTGALDVPPSTAARWIATLKDRGLIESTADPADATRLAVSLTDEGLSRMDHLATQWASAFVSI